MQLIGLVEQAGIVRAGGGEFSAHVKLGAKSDSQVELPCRQK
jgi:Na+-translocating ferredoxin:NAD+ oxidoreductase RnfC subunit